MDDSFSYLAIIGFLALSAFFSGSETAFFSLSKIQLKKIEHTKSKQSKRILRLLKNPRQLLIIILLGNTIVNVAASSTAALIAIKIGDKLLKGHSEIFALLVEVIIMTNLLLIFGEISPKLIAFSFPEKFARFASSFLEIIKYLLWPIIIVLDFIGNLFSNKKAETGEVILTTEDLRNLIKSKAAMKTLEKREKEIITSIFRFTSTTASEIITPRVDMVAAEASEGLNKVQEIIIESGHSKIPIYKKNIDNIIGVIYAKDIILNPNKQTISSLLRPTLYITENIRIQNLLNQFKSQKIQIAIVVDEYGGTSGLLTLEDILEELVGDIMDEYDKELPMSSKISKYEYILSGMYTISELNEKFALNINEEKYDNLAEFLYDTFDKVPKRNESIEYEDKARFTISNIKGQRINYVRMRLLQQTDEIEE